MLLPVTPAPREPLVVLFVYVDNSNLWIEGMRVSAVRKGLAADAKDAMNRHISQPGLVLRLRQTVRGNLPGYGPDWAVELVRLPTARERLLVGAG